MESKRRSWRPHFLVEKREMPVESSKNSRLTSWLTPHFFAHTSGGAGISEIVG